MIIKKFLNHPLSIAFFLLILSIPASLPLLSAGFYEPHDLHHFADIYQMIRAFQSGQLPPRLGPDFSFGYGYPLFNFYYLMPFYLGSFFFFLFGSITASFKLVFLVCIISSVLGMYLFLREFTGKWGATVGSILFLYTPYRAVQIYVRGAMGEALALSLLPLVLWGITRIIRNPNNKNLMAGVSLITATFILSHNYLWALSFPWILLLIIFLMAKRGGKRPGKSLMFTGLLSIGLTAYWWLPALLENKLVASKTPFPLIDHFPFIKQLIIPSWGYGSSVWGPGDEISFQIGLINLFVLAFFALLLIFKQKLFRKKGFYFPLWALIGFLASVLMMNSRTYFIWKIIPFHNFIQFPWRLLVFTTLFSSVLAAIIVDLVSKKGQKFAGILVIGTSMALTFNYFQPSKIFYKTDNNYLARLFSDRTLEGKKETISDEYLNYSEDYLLLSKWTDKRPSNLPESKIQASANAEIKLIKEINPTHWQAKVEAKQATKIIFHSYYFPGWFAKLDGKNTEISAAKPYGQIELQLSKGEHEVEFFWKETPLRKVSDLISLLSLILVIIVLVPKKLTFHNLK